MMLNPPESSVSFVPGWWCANPHAQTLWGSLLRPVPSVVLHRERWETPDGDFLDLDHLAGEPGAPLVLLLHGLEGSSRSRQIAGFLAAARRKNWRGLAVNFRSCSGEINRLRRSYHGGETSDLDWVIQRVLSKNAPSKIFCVGGSLGGNVLLKYLGEQGDALPAQIRAAAAISTPFDLEQSAYAIEKGFAKIYMARLVQSLKSKTRAKVKAHPQCVDLRALARVRTMAEFDDLVTAPVNGFKSARDYWQDSSSKQYLSKIRRPALLINAKDDPFLPESALPVAEIAANRYLKSEFPRQGGHLGFIGGSLWKQQAWAEERAFEFFEEAGAGG
ncbi:MAG: hydrolase [Candidatus Omnitrophica bacterium]|nr:hydrolase [Candidatus Omnitrophota bacterium]